MAGDPGDNGAAPRWPARVLEIPSGVALSNEEIVAALRLLHSRKQADSGQGEFTVEEAMAGDACHTVKLATTAVIRPEDVVIALTKLNLAAEHGDADVLFTFASGQMVKKGWVTLKDRREAGTRHAGGTPRATEF